MEWGEGVGWGGWPGGGKGICLLSQAYKCKISELNPTKTESKSFYGVMKSFNQDFLRKAHKLDSYFSLQAVGKMLLFCIFLWCPDIPATHEVYLTDGST